MLNILGAAANDTCMGHMQKNERVVDPEHFKSNEKQTMGIYCISLRLSTWVVHSHYTISTGPWQWQISGNSVEYMNRKVFQAALTCG